MGGWIKLMVLNPDRTLKQTNKQKTGKATYALTPNAVIVIDLFKGGVQKILKEF